MVSSKAGANARLIQKIDRIWYGWQLWSSTNQSASEEVLLALRSTPSRQLTILTEPAFPRRMWLVSCSLCVRSDGTDTEPRQLGSVIPGDGLRCSYTVQDFTDTVSGNLYYIYPCQSFSSRLFERSPGLSLPSIMMVIFGMRFGSRTLKSKQ